MPLLFWMPFIVMCGLMQVAAADTGALSEIIGADE